MFPGAAAIRPSVLSQQRKEFIVCAYIRANYKGAVPSDIIPIFAKCMNIIKVPRVPISVVDQADAAFHTTHGTIIGLPTKDVKNEHKLMKLFKSAQKKMKAMDVRISKLHCILVKNWSLLKAYDTNVKSDTLFLYVRFASRNDHSVFHLMDKTKLGFNVIIPVKKPKINHAMYEPYCHYKDTKNEKNDYKLNFQHPQQLFAEHSGFNRELYVDILQVDDENESKVQNYDCEKSNQIRDHCDDTNENVLMIDNENCDYRSLMERIQRMTAEMNLLRRENEMLRQRVNVYENRPIK